MAPAQLRTGMIKVVNLQFDYILLALGIGYILSRPAVMGVLANDLGSWAPPHR